MNVKKEILEVFEEIGVYVQDYDSQETLGDFIQDSLSLVSFIVFLESNYSLEIDAKYLDGHVYEMTMDKLEQVIQNSKQLA